jgi:molecular chaperone GrpE (heat shock protein)
MFKPKFNKKRHFQEMLVDIDKAIAELELKKFTLLNSREVYRGRYDTARTALEALKSKDYIDEENKKKDIEMAEQTVEQSKKVMDALDREINGAPPTEESEGVQGIDNQLQSWVERREVAKEFIRLNC